MTELLSGPTLYIIGVLVVAILAMFLGKLNLRKKMPSIDIILKYAHVAVNAVEKLADNGQYANLEPAERHARKKADAIQFIETALKNEFGIEPNVVLRYLIDMAIEAVLKQLGE